MGIYRYARIAQAKYEPTHLLGKCGRGNEKIRNKQPLPCLVALLKMPPVVVLKRSAMYVSGFVSHTIIYTSRQAPARTSIFIYG
jgi:hypothetical protein